MWTLKSLKAINIISFKNIEFQFRNGKAMIVTGSNLDDSAQKVNGSGKSSLIESIAIAFSGTSIRDVKVKELINNESTEGEVMLTLFNSQLNQTLIIRRKLFSNTKAAEYQAWINGVDQKELYSDFNTFNAWVWKILGISKEDFFSFYLITSDAYEPFLSVGDTKKKEIINRFSGADKVDIVFPTIQEDSEAVGLLLSAEERKLLSNTTKKELLEGQLQEENNLNSDEKRNQVIAEKELDLQNLILDAGNAGIPNEEMLKAHEQEVKITKEYVEIFDNAISTALETFNDAVELSKLELTAFDEGRELALKPFNELIELAKAELRKFDAEKLEILQPFNDNIELAELEVEAFEFNKDYPTIYKNFETQKEEKNKTILFCTRQLPLVKDQQEFKDLIAAIISEEKEYQKEIDDTNINLTDLEKSRGILENQLHDSIECPACKHKFSLKDETFNYDTATEKITVIKKSIAEHQEIITLTKQLINTDIQQKKQEVNQKILAAQETIKTEIATLNEQIVTIGQEEAVIRAEEQLELNAKQELIDLIASRKREYAQKENELATKWEEFSDKVKAEQRKLTQKNTELDHDRLTFNNKVAADENALKQKKTDLDNERLTLTNNVRRCELNLQQKQTAYNNHQESIKAAEKHIAFLKNQEPDNTKILKLEGDIRALSFEEVTIRESMEKYRKQKEGIDCWELNFKSFKSFLANKSIGNIQDYSNLFLQNMGSNIQICIDGYKTLASKKIKEQITTSVLRDGFDAGSYGKFSGGERGRVDISVILSIQELINLNSPFGGIDFLCADEILDQVDVMGLESIVTSIQSLGKTIMIVSQNDINSSSEYTLVIQKQNKVSTILN